MVVPDETISTEGGVEGNEAEITIKKSTAGAAAAGALVGLFLLGPLGAVICGGAGAYCTTRKEGKIGEYARDIGEKTYAGLAKAKNTAEVRLKDYLARNPNALDCGPPSSRLTNVDNDDVVTPTAPVRGVPIVNTKR